MSSATREPTQPHTTAPTTGASDEPTHRRLVKVYLLSEAERRAFYDEAGSHGQTASEYARFILQARKDPLMFLHLCRLRDPAFAQGLLGKPTEAGRVAELERDNLALTHDKADLLRERDELARKCEEQERRLAELTEKTQSLAAQVVDLARVQEANRDRAVKQGTAYEAIPKPLLAVVKALSVGARPTRKELEARLAQEGMGPEEASQAVAGASRLGLIVLSAGGRYVLAKPVQEGEGE